MSLLNFEVSVIALIDSPSIIVDKEKKVKRYYVGEGLVNLSGEDPEADYEAIVECLFEDLVGVI